MGICAELARAGQGRIGTVAPTLVLVASITPRYRRSSAFSPRRNNQSTVVDAGAVASSRAPGRPLCPARRYEGRSDDHLMHEPGPTGGLSGGARMPRYSVARGFGEERLAE